MTDETTTSDGGAVQTLAELVRQRIDETGWSYRELEQRSKFKLGHNRWQQLATGVRLKRFPAPDTLKLIAGVLSVEETAVLLAAGRSLGMDIRRNGPSFAALVPAGTDQLSEPVRDAILRVIRATVSEAIARQGDDESPRTVQSGPSVTEWEKTRPNTARTGQTAARGGQNSRPSAGNTQANSSE